MSTRVFYSYFLALVSLLLVTGNALAADLAGRTYFELRIYTTQSDAQQKRINDYWQKAAVPAYNRAGISSIGVFAEAKESTNSKVYVLIPFPSPSAYAEMPAKLAVDTAYLSAGAEYLNTAKSDPAYTRFESSMLAAFDGMKQISTVPSTADKKPWVFELRTYESHSESRGDNKVAMFNAGEIPLMQEVGLSPVFFGQTLIGSAMPNLVYMVSGGSAEAHKAHWKAFFEAPTWKKLIGDPQYKDNVSKVVSVFLKRLPASQI